MAGTFTQIYIQIVFAVKGREDLIDQNRSTELYKYMQELLKAKGKNQ